MQSFKKIVRNGLYILLGIILLFVIISNILTNYYGYDSVGIFPAPNPKTMGFIRDSAIKQLTLESLYKERLNDSIYIARYKDDYGLILWRIDQYKNTSLSTFIDTNQMPIKREQLTYYVDISPKVDTHVEVESKAFLPAEQSLSVHFDNCKNIHFIRKNNNYQYYHLKAGAIFLVSGMNKYYDVSIGLRNYTDIDFMVCRFDNRIYIIALYSIKDTDVNPEELFKMFNKNFFYPQA